MSKEISTRKRMILREKHGNVCQICGKEVEEKEMCVEHVIPKSKGGNNSIENLSLTCRTCNLKKGVSKSCDFKTSKIISEFDFLKKLINYEKKNKVFEAEKMRVNILDNIKSLEYEMSKLKELLIFVEGEENESN